MKRLRTGAASEGTALLGAKLSLPPARNTGSNGGCTHVMRSLNFHLCYATQVAASRLLKLVVPTLPLPALSVKTNLPGRKPDLRTLQCRHSPCRATVQRVVLLRRRAPIFVV